MGLKKLNWNDPIKVKLTDHGKDIYYHQHDDLIARGINITPSYPIVDDQGYSTFQLWSFMMLYGAHIGMTKPSVVSDFSFYINDSDLEEVEAMWEKGSVNVWGNEFTFEAKVFEECSPLGINNGRISKLQIIKGKDDWSWDNTVVNYDRGWNICPADEASKAALEYVLNLYK